MSIERRETRFAESTIAARLQPAQLVEVSIINLVSRAIWPGKHILNSGYEFSQTYYELPVTVYTSSG